MYILKIHKVMYESLEPDRQGHIIHKADVGCMAHSAAYNNVCGSTGHRHNSQEQQSILGFAITDNCTTDYVSKQSIGAKCSSVVKAFTHGGPIMLFLIPASAPRLV